MSRENPLEDIDGNAGRSAAAGEHIEAERHISDCRYGQYSIYLDRSYNLLMLQRETGMTTPMPPRLGQYLGEVFPSSRTVQDSGVGLSPPPEPPPVRGRTAAAEPTVARAQVMMVLASILIVWCGRKVISTMDWLEARGFRK